MDLSDNLTEIVIAAIGILALGAFLVIKKNNKVNQKNIKTKGGDVVGRDKIVKKK